MKNIIKKILKEEFEDIDNKVMNFLLRRYVIKDLNLGKEEGFKLDSRLMSFEGLPDYTISSISAKKDRIYTIFNMLYDNNIIDQTEEDVDVYDPYRQKIIRTIKEFLKYVFD